MSEERIRKKSFPMLDSILKFKYFLTVNDEVKNYLHKSLKQSYQITHKLHPISHSIKKFQQS
jgi:hypothetical protein